MEKIALVRICVPRINGAKILPGNRLYLHPVVTDMTGEYPDYTIEEQDGWKLIGWGSPPYAGSGPHAFVYECLSKDVEDGVHEVGEQYWGHWDADKVFLKLKGEKVIDPRKRKRKLK
jgi:hypothetical protein